MYLYIGNLIQVWELCNLDEFMFIEIIKIYIQYKSENEIKSVYLSLWV